MFLVEIVKNADNKPVSKRQVRTLKETRQIVQILALTSRDVYDVKITSVDNDSHRQAFTIHTTTDLKTTKVVS